MVRIARVGPKSVHVSRHYVVEEEIKRTPPSVTSEQRSAEVDETGLARWRMELLRSSTTREPLP